ncbi:MAG TPA: PPC domain-containing DNA-binding protein [Methylomirabilota bacterium]|nr:PPC domain-containing DNA-binding protein [Methylomirabilota bacterium]
MITRRDLLATAALGLTACGFDTAQAQEAGTSRADLPRVEILTDNEVRTYLLVFRTGQEVMKGLLGFAREHGVMAGQITGIGALSDAVIGYFDPATKAYLKRREEGQQELLSLTGNVARYDGAPFYHIHVALGRRDGGAGGGHLFEATVRPTVEVVVTTYAKAMRRQMDSDWGLPLLAAR